MPSMPSGLRVFFIAFSVWLAFVFGAVLGVYFGGHYYRLSPLMSLLPQSVRTFLFPGDNLLQLEREIEGILNENFYKPVDRASLENGAIEGMIESLNDPYSAYLTPEEFRRYQEHTKGTFSGVGVTLEPKDGQLLVVSTLDNSPAQQAGIKAGDLIVAVDEEAVAGRAPEEAAAMIRGEEGTTVVLRIRRNDQEIDIPIVRKSLELPIVSDKMLERDGKKIGYIKLEQFSLDAGSKVKGSMDKLINEGAQGIIFDLRNNGGGLLEEAVNVSSVFIQNGPIVSVVSRDQSKHTYEARGDANESIPLVVLINNYTASASEIVAGAIKDDGRGKLIGEKTFGKGVVQNLDPLSNGGAIKFTSGSYFTPKGIDINKIGIEPDVSAADDPATPADEVLDRGLAELVP